MVSRCGGGEVRQKIAPLGLTSERSKRGVLRTAYSCRAGPANFPENPAIFVFRLKVIELSGVDRCIPFALAAFPPGLTFGCPLNGRESSCWLGEHSRASQIDLTSE
jgi:hypothetical protein